MFTKLMIILGLMFTVSAFASESDISIEKEKTSTSASEKVMSSDFKEKAELYKILYENSKSANERLISTIHLIIGVVITFLIALFGTQFLFNFKLKKEEIHNIEANFDKKISNSNTEFTKQINTLYNEKEKIFKEEFNSFKQEVGKSTDIRFSDENKSIDLKFDKYRQEIKSAKSILKYQIELVDIKLEKNIGDVWGIKGVEVNALGRYTDTALLELKNEHDIKYTLSDIITILNKQAELPEYRKEALDNLVSLLPEKYESQKDAIVSKLNSLKIFKYVDDPVNIGQKITKTVREPTA